MALWFKSHGMESGFFGYVTACIACSLMVYLIMPDTRYPIPDPPPAWQRIDTLFDKKGLVIRQGKTLLISRKFQNRVGNV